MKAIGIICELNPMHTGHCYLIDVLRTRADALVGVMSGPFVQRGEPAVFDKWDRARIAVQNGFDLIIELPQIAVLQSAQHFAEGAIRLLDAIPNVTGIGFGVEDGLRTADMEALVDALGGDALQSKIASLMAGGMSYRHAIEMAIGRPLKPNIILGMEYLRAIRRLSCRMKVIAVPRVGGDHHDDRLTSIHPSATALRASLRSGSLSDISAFLAPNTDQTQLPERIPSLDALSNYLAWRELLDPIGFAASPNHEPGMAQRWHKALEREGRVEAALSACANSRQSISRYRRMIVSSLLGIKRGMRFDPYLRPLAMNAVGAQLLKSVRVPIVQKLTLRKLSPDAETSLQIDLRAQAVYERLCGHPTDRDYRNHPFISEDNESNAVDR